jgi:cytochrome c-type biogenesis protein CcmH
MVGSVLASSRGSRSRALVATLVAGLALLLAAPASAQDPQGWAYDVANELMSPFCPGRTLADCPSPQADTLRMWLIVQEAAGRSREEVEVELVERFGEGILPAPRAVGFGIAAWVVPVVIFLAGGVLVVVILRRITARPGAAPAPAAPEPAETLDPALERAVDEDLSR